MQEVVIIGAGITGLTLAWRLQQRGQRVLIVEARDRIGGRVRSIPATSGSGFVELGPTWFGDQHEKLRRLLQELGIDFFPQYEKGKGIFQIMSFAPPQIYDIPQGQAPYYRLHPNTLALPEALYERLAPGTVRLRTGIARLERARDHIRLFTAAQEILTARRVVSTIPLPLFQHALTILPELDQPLQERLATTQTWMSDSIKFAVEYQRPFWRDMGYAGQMVSQSGLIKEMHDHCDRALTSFVLMGFLHHQGLLMPYKERRAQVVAELSRIFGPAAAQPQHYFDKNWTTDPLTSEPQVQPMTFKPDYGHESLREPLWDGRLWLAASETSDRFGGYMEGSVHRAEQIAGILS